MDIIVVLAIFLVFSVIFNVVQYFSYRKEINTMSNDTYKYAEDTLNKLRQEYDETMLKLRLSNNNYEVFFNYMRDRLKNARIRMDEVDRGGSFKSDDEVGFIFDTIYDVSADLAKFIEDASLKAIDEQYLQSKVNK